MTTKEQILRLYRSGNTHAVIAKFLDISVSYVKATVCVNGLSKTKLTKEDAEIIVSMAKRGFSRSDIAEAFSVEERTIGATLRRHGVFMKRGRRRIHPKTHRWIISKKTHSI